MLLQTRFLVVLSVALLLGVASGQVLIDGARGALSIVPNDWEPSPGSAVAAASAFFAPALERTSAVARDSGASREAILGRTFFSPGGSGHLTTAIFVFLVVIGVSGLVLRYRSRLDASGSTQSGGSRSNGGPGGVAQSAGEPSSVVHRSEASTTHRVSAPLQVATSPKGTDPKPTSAMPQTPDVAPAATPLATPMPDATASPAAATAAAATKPLTVVRGDSADPDEEVERLAQRLKAARDHFRRGLDALREEAFALTRSDGPLVAPWGDSIWDGWDAASAAAGNVADRGVRVGDMKLFAGGEGEDVWTVPAVVSPARWGAVVVEADSTEIERVRWAIVGWCIRLIAAMGPGRVGVVWLEEGGATGVPAAWRAPSGSALTPWFERRMEDLAGSQQTGTRWVVVGLGSVADAVPDLGPWVADCAEASLSSGVSLWLAPSRRVQMASQHVARLAMVPGKPGRFQSPAEVLGRHEVRLQELPPPELVQRYAGWVVSADGESHSAVAESVPPALAAAETSAITPAAAADGDQAAPPVSVAARLRALLAAPAPRTPRLVLGQDADGHPVEFALDAPLRLRGGSADEAAARLATQVLEIACQTHADAWEFAVLDFSDDVAVADRFDAILDLTPHLIEYTEGVGAHIKLDDTLERLSHPDLELPDLALIVVAHPTRPFPDGLERVLRSAPEARVHPLVWQATSGPSDTTIQPGDAVLTLDVPTNLRVVGQPARPLLLDQPLAAAEPASLAGALQQARA